MYVKIASAISKKIIQKVKLDISKSFLNDKNNQFGYYLVGLFEGDGHISLPFLGNSTLNRVLNPRIVFTSHINNLAMYAFILSELGNIGRFQYSGDKAIRYIIGDIKGKRSRSESITLLFLLNKRFFEKSTTSMKRNHGKFVLFFYIVML